MVARAGGREDGSYCVMGIEFQFHKIKRVTVMAVAIAQQCECVTELYVHLRMVQDSKFYAVCILQ